MAESSETTITGMNLKNSTKDAKFLSGHKKYTDISKHPKKYSKDFKPQKLSDLILWETLKSHFYSGTGYK